jgi:hypothetical protein
MAPRNDIDEDVIWLGTGHATGLDAKRKNLPKKNPIGFIWPKSQQKARATAKRRSSPGRKKR